MSCSNITVRHVAEYFAHRGGKENLGKEKTANHCAKLSVAMTGKNLGKKHTNKTLAKLSEAQTGKKHTLKTVPR